jgi:multidrug transporter EmrE-like cation transporter
MINIRYNFLKIGITMKSIILFLIATLSASTSSAFWKLSAKQILKTTNRNNLLLEQLTNLWFILGWIFYFFATFLWIYLLGKYDFSKIYPIFVGSCIVLSLITGLIFFKENTGM